MPVWGWIALAIGLAFVALVVLSIWHYPDDNSF